MTENTFDTFWSEHTTGLIDLIKHIKSTISDEYRAFEFDEEPGIQLTISVNEECTEWIYQTGDNSYTGSCYLHPYWGVIGIYKNSEPEQTAKEVLNDLSNIIFS